jgi:hypothetical protein
MMSCIAFDYTSPPRIFISRGHVFRRFPSDRDAASVSAGGGRMTEHMSLVFVGLSLRFPDLEQIDSSGDILDLLAVLNDQNVDHVDSLEKAEIQVSVN